MKSYFFNAEPTEDLTNHPTGYDREYDADDHAAFFAPFFAEAGVMAGTDSGACKVSVQSGTTLKVAAGPVYVKGRMGLFEGTETICYVVSETAFEEQRLLLHICHCLSQCLKVVLPQIHPVHVHPTFLQTHAYIACYCCCFNCSFRLCHGPSRCFHCYLCCK